MRSDKKSSYTNSKVQPLVQLETTDGGGKPGRYPAYGEATDGDEGDYAVHGDYGQRRVDMRKT